MAFRMQQAAPEATDLAGETPQTRKLYGMDDPKTENFGTMCLMARRLAERDVRFIQVSHAHSLPFNNEQWDQHSHIKQGHEINVGQIDKPITGLIKDLKQRGLLEDTIVMLGGEFGRTPRIGDITPDGRGHWPAAGCIWMAGGGIKGGITHGATDELGYNAVDDVVSIHDMHATMLHTLGIDHKKMTYRFQGRDFRLTDVEGEVLRGLIA